MAIFHEHGRTYNTEKLYAVEASIYWPTMGDDKGSWFVYRSYSDMSIMLKALRDIKKHYETNTTSGFRQNGKFHKTKYEFRPVHLNYNPVYIRDTSLKPKTHKTIWKKIKSIF